MQNMFTLHRLGLRSLPPISVQERNPRPSPSPAMKMSPIPKPIYSDLNFFHSESCTSLGLWKGLIVASYGDGHLRVFDMETGRMFIEVAAHARWINALDVARNGLVRFLVVLNLKGPFTRTVSMPVSGTVTVKVVMTETILSIGVNLTVTVTETGTEMVRVNES